MKVKVEIKKHGNAFFFSIKTKNGKSAVESDLYTRKSNCIAAFNTLYKAMGSKAEVVMIDKTKTK